jgi:hypothetical protein
LSLLKRVVFAMRISAVLEEKSIEMSAVGKWHCWQPFYSEILLLTAYTNVIAFLYKREF